jgi:hypothetical protein
MQFFESEEVTLKSAFSRDSSLNVEIIHPNGLNDIVFENSLDGKFFINFAPAEIVKLSISKCPPIFLDVYASNIDLLDALRFHGVAVKDVNISVGASITWDIRRTLIEGQSENITATTSSENVAVTHQVLVPGSLPFYGSFYLHDPLTDQSKQFYVNETHETLAKKLSELNAALFFSASLTIQKMSSSCDKLFEYANVANERLHHGYIDALPQSCKSNGVDIRWVIEIYSRKFIPNYTVSSVDFMVMLIDIYILRIVVMDRVVFTMAHFS